MLLIVIILATYNIWAEMGRAKEPKTGAIIATDSKARFNYLEFGIDSGKGNIIGI